MSAGPGEGTLLLATPEFAINLLNFCVEFHFQSVYNMLSKCFTRFHMSLFLQSKCKINSDLIFSHK